MSLKRRVLDVDTKRAISFSRDEAESAVATVEKKLKLSAKTAKLVEDEKRWLRKLRLATTKISKIRSALKRAMKQMEALS